MRKRLLLTASLAFALWGVAPSFAETAVAVPVRVGAHETYDRVVFDWPRDVKFKFRREGNKAVLSFDAPATIKIPANVETSLSRAQGFVASTGEDGHVSISFNVNADASVKTFTNNFSVVVDIEGKALAPASSAPAPSSAPVPKVEKALSPEPQALPQGVASSSAPAVVVDKAKAPKEGLKPQAEAQAKLETPQPESAKLAAPLPEKKEPVPVAKEKPQAPAETKAKTETAPALEPKPESGKAPDSDASKQQAKPEGGIKSAAPLSPSPGVPPSGTKEAAPPPPASLPPPVVADSKITLGDEPRLVASLDPHIQTRAVIYLRANVGYILFDHKLSLSPEDLADGTSLEVALTPLDLPKNSGFRFAVPPNASLQATLDGTAWKIFLSKKLPALPVLSSLIAQPDFALGARFLLPLPDGPDPIYMTDPVIGDDLILVPLAQSQAFNTEQRMVDFAILSAAQGLVMKPFTDKIIVRKVSDGIEITAQGGLLLSPAVDTGAVQQSLSKAKTTTAAKSIFDYATWVGKPGETFTQTRQRLQQTIVDVSEVERNRARLELARFYFAHGQGEEAFALLTYLAKQVPDLRFHGDFMALLGASEILAYRSEEGLRDLSLSSLGDQPEVILWQAVACAQMRDWKQAQEKFLAKEHILAGYPEPFFSRFFVLAIESALATNQRHEAADWLNFVSNSPHMENIDPALLFLRGVLAAQGGHKDEAETFWKHARSTKDRLYKIRAELSLIDLGVVTGSLTPAQAADRLEALRFGWRGDDLEVDILRRLGQFYIQAKNVKAGINVYSQAVTLYPASAFAPDIRTEMAKTLRDAFLGNLGKKLSPLDALTLYRQYRDLLPVGKEGDDLMLNLSERLVSVDLLDQASSLLEDLAKNRLQGEQKAGAVLRLAAIRLLDHKPNESIAALDLLGSMNLSSAQQNERALLRARALFELNRGEEASALLKDNTSPGAVLLRVDIAMKAQKWGEAAGILTGLVGLPPTGGATLSPEQAGWLVSAAIAYALANDQSSLDRLAIDYSPSMASSPQYSAFQMLTRPEKMGRLRDLTAAQAQLSQVDMFQSFLNSYRSSSASPVKKDNEKAAIEE